jgi:hypothetical protein
VLHLQVCPASEPEPKEIRDGDLKSWYKSDWLSNNLRTVINMIKMQPEPAVAFDSSDSKWKHNFVNVDGICNWHIVIGSMKTFYRNSSKKAGIVHGVYDLCSAVCGFYPATVFHVQDRFHCILCSTHARTPFACVFVHPYKGIT